MTIFSATEKWKEQHPGACVGFLSLTNLINNDQSAGLESYKEEVVKHLQSSFSDREEIKSLPQIEAYQRYYKQFKKTYHVLLQIDSVALGGRNIPRVNPLVEAMFAVELKNGLLTAGHDAAKLSLPLTLDSAAGTEEYTLMNGKPQVTKAGDMCVRDGQGVISSIVYGPDEHTHITPQTTSAVFVVYAPVDIGRAAVLLHLDDLEFCIRLFSPDLQVALKEIAAA